MSNMLKCPNPSCPYVFDPSQVPVGVVLSCPRCAMQFTLGPPAPVSQPSTTAAVPPNQSPAQYPATDPDLEAIGRSATAPHQQRQPRQERPAERPKSSSRTPALRRAEEAPPPNRLKVFLYTALGVAVTTIAIGAVRLGMSHLWDRDSGNPDSLSRLQDLNIGVDTPPTGWTRDDNMRVKVGSPYVISYKRENPEAYMTFGANAFGSDHRKGRAPRNSEMRTDLMQAFPKLFDMSQFRPDEPPSESKWLGELVAPNLAFKFRAQSSDGLAWAGDAYAVSHKGFAYYWLSWCGDADYDRLKDEFAAFRSKFKILELRRDWNEAQSNVIDYKGDKVSYRITDAEEVWRETSIEDYKPTDPNLDKRLRINQTPKRDRKAIPDEAELRVYVLDGGGEPLQVARQFVEKKETDHVAGSTLGPPTFEVLTDAEQGDPIVTTVPKASPVVRLRSRVKDSVDASRLIVASGLRVGDKIVVVHCWCEYRKRDVFETKFVQVASSLRE